MHDTWCAGTSCAFPSREAHGFHPPRPVRSGEPVVPHFGLVAVRRSSPILQRCVSFHFGARACYCRPCSRNDTYRVGGVTALTALTAPADSPHRDVTWWQPWPVVRPMPLTGAPARQRGPGELTLRSRGRRHSGGCGGRLTCRCHDAPAGLKARDERLSGRPPAAGQGQTTAGATTSPGAVGRPCRRGPGHTSPGAQAAAWLLHGGCVDTADGRGSRCGCWSWRTRRCSRAP